MHCWIVRIVCFVIFSRAASLFFGAAAGATAAVVVMAAALLITVGGFLMIFLNAALIAGSFMSPMIDLIVMTSSSIRAHEARTS